MPDSRTRRTSPLHASTHCSRVGTGLAALLLLAACGGGNASSDMESTASADAGTSTPAHSREGGDAHTHGEGTHTHTSADTLGADVPLGPGGDGAWSGSATILSIGDSIRVTVAVEGMAAGSRHAVEIVSGSCGQPGPVLVDLTPLAAGSSGAGTSQTAFASSRLEGHAHGGLRVLGGDGAAVACAPVHLSGSEHAHGE